MLGGMLALMIGSSWNDSATFDEVAHIPAGYTYLKYQDSRINPEHPPLLKDLAAFPLLFQNLNFDLRPDFWNIENVNDRQWMAGHALLYEFDNDPDKILFASRLTIMLLAILFGWLLFLWAEKQYGTRVGLLTLFLFVTSPTVLAHARFVTTDLGAAFGFFLGIIFFLKFLERPDWRRTILLGIVLGIVLMFKFSLVLLLPVYGILFLLWCWIKKRPKAEILQEQSAAEALFRLLIAGFIAIAVIWVVYAFHIWNYPQEQNVADVKYILSGYKVEALPKIDLWLVEHKITRPLGQYFFGFLMVARRAAGGNAAYFMGELSSDGWWYYFPTLYLLKEQLLFHLMLLAALILAVFRIKQGERSKEAVQEWIADNFSLFAGIVFIAVYWISSILNPLNIGVRHILPVFPFTYLLVSREIIIWLRRLSFDEPASFWEWVRFFYENYIKPAPKYFIFSMIILFMALNIIIAYPYFLSYYNILGKGTNDGYMAATDSNYDWGQDLKRLVTRIEELNIDKIYLDYFGGGDPKYYLGDKYESWWSAKGPPPIGSYFAVSVNSLMGNQARPVGNIAIKPEDTYSWLKGKAPVVRGGMSILIFKIK
ncbi:hypothetical protein A2W54_03810 [Candidatus Giovannonibacteria bacterium RIFCSPHIGHO2_02_43_13]|uniref:Glycosyltransferase RgtA/B/C/D-like domain-containing protein n=1 Tax=Candidatus Giovannonibacteria bacterium RIFCSPHIGHO2_02_43_13 TaxID=1798330 RepID=A0A1F5WSA7_9BACT|nr:MAG: hypothetical protein A3E06_02920 [Candidatus Giovannonibacteria bacterium RIFCSPHIGHO2_12_FULL_44_42]OGF78201.1 MAG: hypothetical protein A2W54_03810 [Candidatus Giovannonibacteria bacterium RIFCSPHIGHO2_02_43_13]OGF90067.1 MAG: hypothetical protein A3I94_03025 [Candidatus Giovannonibacteria bacterium RIFCSPLOWO2_02_FULL_43_54]OGF96680.1 MAG: hypothetical protein A3H08_01565 [Candidatus Giovannonibacteria bacterium RIFCSPLOWO2_12_FULL_44_32]